MGSRSTWNTSRIKIESAAAAGELKGCGTLTFLERDCTLSRIPAGLALYSLGEALVVLHNSDQFHSVIYFRALGVFRSN